ncbi:coatomer subunit gamma [Sorochytrium milnesiophthora]
MSYAKKDEDAASDIPEFRGYDKAYVLQETRAFNESPLNARKCRALIGKVLSLLYTGEPLQRTEATELFFATTKLFQSKDPALRQTIYLLIKELSDKADNVLMVTQSLSKDINSKPEELFATSNALMNAAASFGFRFGSSSSSSSGSGGGMSSSSGYGSQRSGSMGGGSGSLIGSNVNHRADAIRALCAITDPAFLPSFERFLKQAVVDKTTAVSSAAVVSAYHLFPSAKDVIRRWANEVQEAFNANKSGTSSPAFGYSSPSSTYLAQYHALGLLYVIRETDRMAVAKLIQSLAKSGNVRSQWAQCMLIRFAVKCCADESASYGGKNMVGVEGSLSQGMYEYLKSLCSNNDMVMLEAARALCTMVSTGDNVTGPGLNSTQLQPAVQALQQLLSSTKPSLKFAALRTLNKLAATSPSLVAACNLDMEQLITDTNRSIATFAITTLLKTGTESSVDRLMKQISTFMAEISDEFKIIIVDAIRALALKFPSKQTLMLNFLSGVLREDGGYDYKKSIVEAIFDLVKSVPECTETALAHLCEFIEDCEFTKLAVRILHLLGAEGPKAQTPAKYIRYIYNRVILENSNVRAAAVSALARFGCMLGSDVRKNVKVLLARCLDDSDDEVRDRATFYLHVLEDETLMAKYLKDDTVYSLHTLESRLLAYQSNPEAFNQSFDIKLVPIVTKAEEEEQRMKAKTFATQNAAMAGSSRPGRMDTASPTVGVAGLTSPQAPGAPRSPGPDAQQQYARELGEISEFAPFANTLYKSTARPLELTEKELEYTVTCVKHVFTDWIVFQFTCINTLQDSLLENVSVVMQPDSEDVYQDLQPHLTISANRLVHNKPGKVYVAFKKAAGALPLASFSNKLKYVVKDCDPVTFEPDSEEGFDDEYALNDVDLAIADYMMSSAVPDFQRAWEELGAANEVVETFQLSAMKSLPAAVTTLVDMLGMQPLENTHNVNKDRASHVLILSGVFMPGVRVLARVRMAFDPASGVAMELAVRSEDAEVSMVIANSIS